MIFNYYHILNNINKKEYIGITEKNIQERFSQHKKNLRSGKHPNYLLTTDWEKYGEENFTFELLESLEFETIEEGYEHEWLLINKSQNELYNLAPGGKVNPIYSEVIKNKMIATKQSAVPNIYQVKEISENVFQVIAVYNSQKEIQRQTGFNQGNIGRSIKKHSCSYQHFWINEEDIQNNLLNWKPYRTKINPVAELSEDEQEVVKVHHNAADFEKEYNLKRGIINHSIMQGSRCHGVRYEKISEDLYYKILPITLIK